MPVKAIGAKRVYRSEYPKGASHGWDLCDSQGASAFGVRRSAFVLVLVLAFERCYLQKRRVNQIRSAFPELHPRSGLKVLTRRFVVVLGKPFRPQLDGEELTRAFPEFWYANWQRA
jgi:hypothetical protein